MATATTRGQQQHVAPTDALPPEKQQAEFILPDGFEIQLVVSAPDIGQPMNLSFDARGRLWVTHSVEYPYPALSEGVQPRTRLAGVGEHPPRDRLTVVEAIGPDGRATKIRHFAEGLNIPIGNTPLDDGSSALVYSIPAIFRCTDTDGDGKADRREELFGRFGNIDTHGMASSFTPWIDGWVYGCHGFSNHSVIADAAGSTTEMTSGNTYRFRPDGSRFEQFTHGQVNPFGMDFDPLGNLYDADCHSMPVYMLLRGATYPHFGRKPGPLGFGPKMIDHNHESTGICGVAYYAANHFPPDYRDNLYICNPVTGRVHRDKLIQSGSTYRVDTQPDFIRSRDPWFRPVDALLGPDGALYIADFYNAVIGHYEVPLEHPKRDRTHGRVWRVVYRGTGDTPNKPPQASDLTRLDTIDLVVRQADANLAVRTQATNLLVAMHAEQAPAAVRQAIQTGGSATGRAHGLWVIERLVGLSEIELNRFATDSNRLVRVHLIKALAERLEWTPNDFRRVRDALADDDAFVRRAAADALERHPQVANVAPLLTAWNQADAGDTHLVHTIKLALRSHFESGQINPAQDTQQLTGDGNTRLLEIAAASTSNAATCYILQFARPDQVDAETLYRIVPQVARNGNREQVSRLIALAKATYPQEPIRQFALFRLVSQGLAQRGQPPKQHEAARAWFSELAPALLRQINQSTDVWTHNPIPGTTDPEPPWGVRQRKCADGRTIAVIDSIAGGEQRTGVFRSHPFQVPAELSFWMCGHNGPPGKNPKPINHVRLRLQENDAVVAQAIPPRNDTARKYSWNLQEHAGKSAMFEIVDADMGRAYAWLAVGGFDPPVLRVPSDAPDDWPRQSLDLVGQFQLKAALPRLDAIAENSRLELQTRLAAAEAVVHLGEPVGALFAEVLSNSRADSADRAAAAAGLGRIDREESRQALLAALAQAPAKLQRSIARALCGTSPGAAALLQAIDQGKASARLLQDREIDTLLKRQVSAELKQHAAELVQGLPTVEQRIIEMIAVRRQTYDAENASPARGKAIFTKSCAACHRVGGEGKTIGPQLDGIGLRGLDRLLEDVLDPNRNVDTNFRTTTLVTTSGQVLSGLVRRQEGQVLVLADQQGKEFEVPQAEIDESQRSNLSLMPSNVAEDLAPADFNDLVAYLLSLRAKPTE